MSKKKRAAKLAKQRSHQEMVTRRVDDAIATFQASFPSPYPTSDEEEADRRRCAELRPAVRPDGEDGEDDSDPGAIFRELPDGNFAFCAWTTAFRDELATRLASVEEAARRVRYQLAQLLLTERRREVDPAFLKVAGLLLQLTPFDGPLAAGTDDAEAGAELVAAGEPE